MVREKVIKGGLCGRVGAMGGCIDGPQWCMHFARSLIQREPARSHERVLGCVASVTGGSLGEHEKRGEGDHNGAAARLSA